MKLQRDILQARNGLSYGEYVTVHQTIRNFGPCRQNLHLKVSSYGFLTSSKRTFFSSAEGGMVPDVSVCSTILDHPTALDVQALGNFPETWIGV
jgi:hypothetical protein